mmetsp:Transcript_50365/g.128241  ORF Transcript_50365/g.128241 Transcript_50365/m.128241 type:complete len:211 (-) Transcript_50365:92-724(-)
MSSRYGSSAGPFKIVALGEGRVGKTSLLRRYVRGTFSDREASTQQAAYLEKQLALDGGQVQLSLWDTAGQERFHSLAPIYYRDADGALLVYDITDVESFRRVAKWVEELRVLGTMCPLLIIGNKSDLRTEARVPQPEAEAYARSIGARHCLASAKSGAGVEEAFVSLTQDVVRAAASGSGPASFSHGGVLIAEDAPAQRVRRRDKCCGGA